MKIKVDLDVCEAHAECVAHAPEVFDLGDDDDVVTVLLAEPPESMRDDVVAAARSCPVDAITIED